MIIAIVTVLVALGSFLIRPKEDIRWVKRLNLPRWLAIVEPVIPVIWTVIFTCGAISALLVWREDPGSLKTWLLMGYYLLVEIVTVAYIPVTLRLRSLAIGTVIGGLGGVLGLILAIAVFPISALAALLLVPYLLWSPVGTYATRELIDFNPESI
ncbi:MAG: tryptophan-rich sensory protein [Plectolyngbya sp. WJT66-NPBG17]|jgi:tryptophan-rich sensory protein|nr:tryptophan-rich sensory protein [Plectolyngbya sp. WJT66-NPBG17]MBW4525608.1 tryptophan-rich sensory protein [Phormidium tanganyikae FI6-MK23]